MNPTLILWAVAVAIWRRGKIVSTAISYLHAESWQQAHVAYWQGKPPRGARVVAIGRVIGYAILDKHGKHLSV